VNKCCTVSKASLLTALLSGLKVAVTNCWGRLGVDVGCVGEGGGVAVAVCLGLVPVILSH
jgi:hypothetical protein